MIDSTAIQVRWETFGSKLDERGRRLFAAAVRAAGRGGLALVSKITGLARSTINRGEDDLDVVPFPTGRIRRKGGGRYALGDRDPGLREALRRLVDPDTFGASSGLGVEKPGKAGHRPEVDGLPGGDRYGSRGTAETRLFAPGQS
jgi:hypothetical protein